MALAFTFFSLPLGPFIEKYLIFIDDRAAAGSGFYANFRQALLVLYYLLCIYAWSFAIAINVIIFEPFAFIYLVFLLFSVGAAYGFYFPAQPRGIVFLTQRFKLSESSALFIYRILLGILFFFITLLLLLIPELRNLVIYPVLGSNFSFGLGTWYLNKTVGNPWF